MGLKFYLRGLGVGIVVTALIMGIAAGIDSGEVLSDDEIRERARGLGMVEESTVLSDTFAPGSLNSTIGEISADEEDPEFLPGSDNEMQEEQKEEAEASPSPDAEEKLSDTSEKEDSGGEMAKAAEASAELKETAEAKTPEPSATAEKKETPSAAPTATIAPTATPAETPAPTQAPVSEPTSAPEPEAQQGESVTIQIVSGDSSLAVCKKLAQAGLVESASSYDAYLCQNGYDKRIRAGAFEIPVGATGEEIAGIILKLK